MKDEQLIRMAMHRMHRQTLEMLRGLVSERAYFNQLDFSGTELKAWAEDPSAEFLEWPQYDLQKRAQEMIDRRIAENQEAEARLKEIQEEEAQKVQARVEFETQWLAMHKKGKTE